MPLPGLANDGFLPPGIHAASLREVLARYAVGSLARQRHGKLLRRTRMHKIHPDRKLKNEVELEHSIRTMAKMYAMCEVQAVEPLYTPQLRAEMVEDTMFTIRKIEVKWPSFWRANTATSRKRQGKFPPRTEP